MHCLRNEANGEKEIVVQREAPQTNGYPSIDPVEISDDELLKEIGRESEARLGMDLGALVEAYREGALPDTLAANELAILLRFLECSGGIPAQR